MDCCNYMQYSRQQYYTSSQYYEPVPHNPYQDFYGHHHQLYQEYYGSASSHYYQQWPCSSASFQDYVYNPKEARIRKAMRDANRERSLGASPMLARPNARRGGTTSHSWPSATPQDDLIMSPLAGIPPPPVCFPMSSSTSNEFMMNAYNKLEAVAAPPPPPPPSANSVHTNYMQPSPLAQLQQHAEMWTDYQNMRPRSSGNHPFMMNEVPTYHHGQNPEVSTPLILEKGAQSTPTTPNNQEPGKDQERFIPVFEQENENKTKKSPPKKPLPDFNEAFGSTERGRFQSPPDPRLAPNKGYLDYFFDNSSPIKFDDYQI